MGKKGRRWRARWVTKSCWMISQLDSKLTHRKDKERVEKECQPENQTPAPATTKAPETPAALKTEATTTTEPVCVKTKTLERYRRGRRWRWRWVVKCCHQLSPAKQAKQKECQASDKTMFAGEEEEDKNIRPGKNQKR